MPPMAVVHLSPLDNIVVLARSVAAGEPIDVGGRSVVLRERLGLGHKLALRPIAAGEKILKYGVAIGSATRSIEPGEHVHLHNMKSDYLPTYTLEDGRLFAAGRHA
jgi:altronate dehydratase small subunit